MSKRWVTHNMYRKGRSRELHPTRTSSTRPGIPVSTAKERRPYYYNTGIKMLGRSSRVCSAPGLEQLVDCSYDEDDHVDGVVAATDIDNASGRGHDAETD